MPYYDITMRRRETFISTGVESIYANDLEHAKSIALAESDTFFWSAGELVDTTSAYIVDITCEDVVEAEPEANIRDYPISHPKPFYNI